MEKYLFVGLMALCLVACSKHDKAQHQQAPLKVKTMVVAPQASSANARYVGTIEPMKKTPLSFQTAGRVVSISVHNGQHVRQGQVIAQVDNTQAMNALRSAEATLQHAKDGFDRVSKVHDKGVVSDQKMVEVESQYAQAQSLYDAAKQQLSECSLTAPCNGVVDGLKIEKGETIVPGVQVCSVLDISGYNVRFSVPEKEIRGLEVRGSEVKGTVECSAVDIVLPISITEKGVTANALTHTYDVVARVKGGVDVLMPGLVGIVKVESQKTKEDIVIPAKCILLKPDGHTVWVVEQGKAVRKPITVDGYQADGVRVLSGLQPGDSLIMEGYQKLYNDCAVSE